MKWLALVESLASTAPASEPSEPVEPAGRAPAAVFDYALALERARTAKKSSPTWFNTFAMTLERSCRKSVWRWPPAT